MLLTTSENRSKSLAYLIFCVATLARAFLEAELRDGKKRWAANLSEPQCCFVPLFYIPDVAEAEGTKINWVLGRV